MVGAAAGTFVDNLEGLLLEGVSTSGRDDVLPWR